MRARRRDNEGMAAVSQALIEFANRSRLPAAPGIEIIDTDRYRITLQPDHPIPGPNAVSWIRCTPQDAADVIDEVRATVAPRHLPIMWTIDPETEPGDFADRLAARGILPAAHSPEAAVMVLAIGAPIALPEVHGLEVHDALADPDLYRRADAVNAEAFESEQRGRTPEEIEAQERRRRNAIAAGNRTFLLATIDGEPAGSAWMTVHGARGALINGGAVRAKFRGRGVYRAMVAVRLEMARKAGVPGLAVWGGPMSAPILERLGFEKVGWRRFYVDTSTA